ncbi:hypothetical protein FKH29_22650 [Salmonella enterica]|nr:hypothetical protein [Salmonella enterica]
MQTVALVIFSVLGILLICLMVSGITSTICENKRNKKEELKSIKNRLEKIEDKLNITPDYDEYYY